MGDIIGGIIGGVGSLMGSQQALAGYNFLKKSAIGKDYLPQGGAAESDISALLTGGPNSQAAKSAYNNYLTSTGYQSQRDQGTAAISGSAAARGILNSGGTGKALTQYGQDLASTSFNNYLTQLGAVANRGLQAGQMIGQAGTQGGGNAQTGTSSGFNQFGSAAGSLVNGFSNIFGGL